MQSVEAENNRILAGQPIRLAAMPGVPAFVPYLSLILGAFSLFMSSSPKSNFLLSFDPAKETANGQAKLKPYCSPNTCCSTFADLSSSHIFS